jgi:hypothetical protein
MARFSSGVVRSTTSTWKSQALATSATVGVPASSRSRRLRSSWARVPGLLVLPNALTRARHSGVSRRATKNSESLGFDPGQPPST